MIYWLALLPFSIAGTALALLLAPLLPLAADRGGWLPRWLWWFQTPDNPLDGDAGHLARWDYAMSYAQRVAWLVRNPFYGAEWDGPLAAEIPADVPVWVKGDPWIKNRAQARAGWYFCIVGEYWNFRGIWHLAGDTALMLEFGWKLQPWAQGRGEPGRAMYVCSVRLTAFYP